MMSINSIEPKKLVEQRRIVSGVRNLNEQISTPESRGNGSQARAYQSSRDLKDAMELNNIAMTEDDEAYFNELMKDG